METAAIVVAYGDVIVYRQAPIFERFRFYGESWVISPSTERYEAAYLMDVENCCLFSVTHEASGRRLTSETDGDTVASTRKAAKRFLKSKGRKKVRVISRLNTRTP